MPRKGDFTAVAILKGEDDLSVPWSKAVKRAERKARRSFTRMERAGLRAFRGLRKGAAFLGKGGALAARGFSKARSALGTFTKVAGAGVGVAALAVDQFGKFELEVARLGNVLGKGVDPVMEYEGVLRQMAVQFGTDPIETAQAAYMAFSGGVKTTKKDLQAFLPVALKAAKAGFAEPAIVVDALTTALNVFGKDGLTAVDVANKLFIAEALGKTTFPELAGSLGNVASFAKTMGLSLDEVLAPLIAITKQGVSTDQAVTQLTSVLGGIISPAKKFRKAFKKFKIPFGREAVRQAGGMAAVITKIQAAVARDPNAIVKLFGRKEAQKGLFTVTEEGFADVEKGLQRLQNSSTELDDNWKNVQKRTGFRIQQMKTGFKLLVTELGGGIAEGLGLDKIENIPGSVERAGKKMRSGAKAFAKGFLEALTPGTKFAELDWDEIASGAGTAFGNFIVVLKDLAGAASTAFRTIKDLVTGDDPAKRAIKKQGLVERKDVLTEQIEAEEKRQGRTGVFGGARAFAFKEKGRLAELRKLEELREDIGQKQFDVFAGSAFGKATGAAQFKGDVTAQAIARLRQGKEVLGQAPAPSELESRTAKLLPPAARAPKVEVGGETKVLVEFKGAPAGTKTTVEATTKNPKVPNRAKVGKRTGASE